MQAEGPGRRLIWSLIESGNLTDLRRRIGYHEQTLQLWYMTLVYGSLRRLEGGQEDIIAAIKSLHREEYSRVSRSLLAGDTKPLKQELRYRGISAVDIEANMETAIDYITAPPIEKLRMESQVQSRSTMPTRHVNEDRSRGPSRNERPSDGWLHFDNEFPAAEYESLAHNHPRKGDFGRSNSTSAGPKYRPLEDYFQAEVQLEKNLEKERLRKVAAETGPRVRERRASESVGSRAHTRPVLIVNDSTLPNQSQPPPTSHHRSKSRRERGRSSSADIGRDPEQEQPTVIVLEHRGGRSKDRKENKNRKDVSTHSYVRRRRSSVESTGRAEDKDNSRIVHVMNRIDSIPVDTE